MNCWQMSTIKITIHGMNNAVLRFDYFVKRIVSYTYIYKRGCTYEYIELVYSQSTLQNAKSPLYTLSTNILTFVPYTTRIKC